jgi:hypothetical protein
MLKTVRKHIIDLEREFFVEEDATTFNELDF